MTTGPVALTGLQIIDGIALASGDRVLVKDQANAIDNGIYVVDISDWYRSLDFDGTLDAVGGTQILVREGFAGTDKYWKVDGNGPIAIGSDPITFIQTLAIQGNPGGNLMSVGPFEDLSGEFIPPGIDLLQTSGPTRGLVIRDASLTDADVAAHPLAIVKSLDGGYWRRDIRNGLSVVEMGADPTQTSGSDAAIQAAIDYTQAFMEAEGLTRGSCPVIFTPGSYKINSTIHRRSSDLIGIGSMGQGVELVWGGATGGTLMDEASPASPGGLSFGSVRNLAFRGLAGNLPAILYDMTTSNSVIDVGFLLARCGFSGASDCGIKLSKWVNLHWEHLRFEMLGQYAIRASQPSDASARSFSIQEFTYDNKGVGRGFLRLENTGGAAKGIVALKTGRVELNTAPWTDERAFISVAPNGIQRPFTFSLEDLTFATDATVVSAGGNSLVYIDDSMAGSLNGKAEALQFTNVSAWQAVGGNYSALAQPNPTLFPSMAYVQLSTSNANCPMAITDVQLLTGDGSALYPLNLKQSSDDFQRFRVKADGSLEMGTGAAATDTMLSRHGDGRFANGGRPIGRFVAPPTSASAAGLAGDYSIQSGFFYICVATNTWMRAAIATF